MFLDKSSLRLHMKRQHPVKKIVDKQERDQIRREESRIRGKRRVVCEHCNKNVNGLKTLRMHLKVHERIGFAPRKNFDCTMCHGKYKSEEARQTHVVKYHSGAVYQCDFCDHTSTSPKVKSRHLTRRHGTKTLQCSYCDKIFSSRSVFNTHIKSRHEKVKDKQCPHCGEAFQASRAFHAHVNRHTDNRQFACETCGKAFLVESHLKEHAKRHTLPYLCDKCDSRFGSDLLLKTHRRIVHEQRQIQCRHGCSWSCWESSSRNRHEKSCKLNPLPGAPYTVSVGTASILTLQVTILCQICSFLDDLEKYV